MGWSSQPEPSTSEARCFINGPRVGGYSEGGPWRRPSPANSDLGLRLQVLPTSPGASLWGCVCPDGHIFDSPSQLPCI